MHDLAFDALSYAARYSVDNLPAELTDAVRGVIFKTLESSCSKPEIKVEKDWDDEAPELDSFLTDITAMEAK